MEELRQLRQRIERLEIQRQARQLVSDALWQMDSVDDYGQFLEALRVALELLGVPYHTCGINIIDTGTQSPGVRHYTLNNQRQWYIRQATNPILVELWRQAVPAYRPDLSAEDNRHEQTAISEEAGTLIRSVVDIPFPHGTLAVNSTQPHAFAQENIDLLQELARVVGEGFARLEDLQTLDQRNQALEAEVAERRKAETDLQKMQGQLEQRVEERTLELRHIETALRAEISDRKRAEQALQESEQRLRRMVENLPAGAVYVEDDLLVLNRAVEEITGYDRNAITTLDDWFKKIHGDQTASLRSYYMDARKTGFSGPGIVSIFHRDGSTRQVEFAGYSDETSEVWLLTDVSQRLRAEADKENLQDQLRQAQKMESVGLLAGGIAHDFNNQLGIIMFDVELLLEGVPDDWPMRRDLEQIRAVVRRSADLIRQLLIFSSREPMDKKPLDLNRQIREVRQLFNRLLGEPITVELALADHLGWIQADPANIDQILTNLAVNARDAMPEGGTLSICTRNTFIDQAYCQRHPQARQGHFVHLRVSDTGIGMDKDLLNRVFDPFFTTKAAGKGTGLGLAVVYGVVQAHEGWLTVESGLDEGSRFDIYLPVLEAPPTTEATAPKPGPAVAIQGEKILLIEDEPDLRDRLQRVLAKRGYQVSPAGSLEEGRQLFQRRQGDFDLLLTDVVLPDGKGPHLAAELTAVNSALNVLLISGYADAEIGPLQGDDKSWPLLQKPISVEDLITAIQQAVAG
ncbi:MAG: response regulator [Candidatus Latescibacteria bacterium]|nr:response regulator [Candidatus Latescibacterota bacterium]